MEKRPRQGTPFLYFLIARVIKLGLSLFFQKIDVRHAGNIPEQGPVVFAANHPNSTMDGLLMSTVTTRMVHHIAHAGLFHNRIKAWLLRNCGVIPIRRRGSGEDSHDRNLESFTSCFEVLEQGGVIGIFPEGISDYTRQIKKLKTGTARIVLEAERKNGFTLGVRLIPIGIHFFSRSRFRSKVLVNVGRSVDLAPYFALHKEDATEAMRQLTEHLQDRMEHLTINIRYPELEESIRDLEVIYREDLKSPPLAGAKAPTQSVEDFVLSQKIAECVEYFYERDPRRVRSLQSKVAAYKRKMRRFHMKDSMLRDKISVKMFMRREIVNIFKAALGLPLAIYGILNNNIPFRLTEAVAKKYLSERTKILTALFLGGGTFFLLFHTAQAFFVWYIWGTAWSLAYFLSLAPSGLFALAYTRRVREERERISFSFFFFTRRHLVGKMRLIRRELISELDTAKDEWLEQRDSREQKSPKAGPSSIHSVIGDIEHAVSLERFGPKISERVLWRVETEEYKIALTFDDGPHPESTIRVLEILNRHNVPATFFLVGRHLVAHPEIAQAILREGHEIGNHTFTHPPMFLLTEKQVRKEIQDTDELLRGLDASFTPKYLRPPSGMFTTRVLDIAEEFGYRVVIGDVYPRDTYKPGAARIVQRVLERTTRGSIIILHDGGNTRRVDRSQTLEALEDLIVQLLDRGFEFATLSSLQFGDGP
jgi:glycerol-3-phosphate O-acyltransferase/dihydroxyacetone phosphate acyltransferase